MQQTVYFVVVLSLVGASTGQIRAVETQESTVSERLDEPSPIAPAKSLETGLLLESPLDLAWFTRPKFEEMMSTIGASKIRKPWTKPVVPLPSHEPANETPLTEATVKRYMRQAKRLFDQGKAIPVSDVGLISTQEDVIRQPMLNHICGFENKAVRVYLLVQKTAADKDWGYYSIVQDLTVDPPLDYYGHIAKHEVRFEGTSCYKCHSSGPLAIHPARKDLVLDAKLAASLSQHIADQPRSRFHFPKHSPRPMLGKPMTLSACTSCHEEDGARAPLFQVHSHPIRVMVDFGYMPPDERLSQEEIRELKAWFAEGDGTLPAANH